jgi:3'(2'), 5'-bisphosphate nucleotidase
MLTDYSSLLNPLQHLAQAAGHAILEQYQKETTQVTLKDDNTPLTAADLIANQIIITGLQQLTAQIPIISEETHTLPFAERQKWSQYWLIDPLDGTKEFIEHTDEFTVNIALIENHQPVLGIVWAPALKVGYAACRGCGAFKYSSADDSYQFISTRPCPPTNIIIAISRRHGPNIHQYLAGFGEHQLLYKGSALKICLVAEGLADIYPRRGLTSEWDTAAGQCILEEAGGRLMDMQGNEFRYNTKPSVLNSEFMAVGDWRRDWLSCLPQP